MKTTLKTLIFGLLAFAFALSITSCGDDSDDPKPVVAKTDLEKVKEQIKGTWTFKSATVTQISSGKSATTTSCANTELKSAGFTNDKWQGSTPQPNLIYSGTNKVGYNLPCLVGNPTADLTWIATETADKNVKIALSNGRNFFVKPSDVSDNKIIASVENSDGYTVVITFTK